MSNASRTIRLPNPDLQVEFSACLAAARKAYLAEALSSTVAKLDIQKLDAELGRLVPKRSLRAVAAAGLRGELIFPVPVVLGQTPRLLAYYRLLLGHSQKAFYDARNGTTPYKCMEEAGRLPNKVSLQSLCAELIRGLALLVEGIGASQITRDLLDDLTLLTLGPQLRGGANVRKGSASIGAVFERIRTLVLPAVTAANEKRLILQNAAGRRVIIQFASDHPIVIREAIGKDSYRNIIAIEVKGGTDFSDIHNRLGEAEKSHQKARQCGYVECWTIVNVHKLDEANARRESPSTNRFYRLSEIIQPDTAEFADFNTRIMALTGLSNMQGTQPRKLRNNNERP